MKYTSGLSTPLDIQSFGNFVLKLVGRYNIKFSSSKDPHIKQYIYILLTCKTFMIVYNLLVPL